MWWNHHNAHGILVLLASFLSWAETGGLKGVHIHDAQREGKLDLLQVQPSVLAARIFTDPTGPTDPPGLPWLHGLGLQTAL